MQTLNHEVAVIAAKYSPQGDPHHNSRLLFKVDKPFVQRRSLVVQRPPLRLVRVKSNDSTYRPGQQPRNDQSPIAKPTLTLLYRSARNSSRSLKTYRHFWGYVDICTPGSHSSNILKTYIPPRSLQTIAFLPPVEGTGESAFKVSRILR